MDQLTLFWLVRTEPVPLRQQTTKQTIVAGFQYFFSFFTPNVNFSDASVHVGAKSDLKDETEQREEHMEKP